MPTAKQLSRTENASLLWNSETSKNSWRSPFPVSDWLDRNSTSRLKGHTEHRLVISGKRGLNQDGYCSRSNLPQHAEPATSVICWSVLMYLRWPPARERITGGQDRAIDKNEDGHWADEPCAICADVDLLINLYIETRRSSYMQKKFSHH